MDTSYNQTSLDATKIAIEMAVESWRFSRVFMRALGKLDAGESQRYLSQLKYHIEKLEKNLGSLGVRLVNLEGHPYDAGMAVKALNMEDFTAEDLLVVEQMLEPVIMGGDGLLREGTVMLKKVQK